MNEFLQPLKQRKLVQWAVADVAAAFTLLQGIDNRDSSNPAAASAKPEALVQKVVGGP